MIRKWKESSHILTNGRRRGNDQKGKAVRERRRQERREERSQRSITPFSMLAHTWKPVLHPPSLSLRTCSHPCMYTYLCMYTHTHTQGNGNPSQGVSLLTEFHLPLQNDQYLPIWCHGYSLNPAIRHHVVKWLTHRTANLKKKIDVKTVKYQNELHTPKV